MIHGGISEMNVIFDKMEKYVHSIQKDAKTHKLLFYKNISDAKSDIMRAFRELKLDEPDFHEIEYYDHNLRYSSTTAKILDQENTDYLFEKYKVLLGDEKEYDIKMKFKAEFNGKIKAQNFAEANKIARSHILVVAQSEIIQNDLDIKMERYPENVEIRFYKK